MERFEGAPRGGRLAGWGLSALLVILLATSVYALMGVSRERRHAEDLAKANQSLNLSLHQMQTALESVSGKLNALAAQRAAHRAVVPVARKPKVQRRAERITMANNEERNAPDDPRWQQMQARLTDQDQRIASTRDEVAKSRQDLEDKLTTAHDELNGSIAKNHDELVALQKLGERNYYEFELDKSKQFQHVGPLSLSLRKANSKRLYYDLALMVDDRQLEKKHANLYEPLMFSLADRPEPIQVVVNQIDKNKIKGYISEPKYKRSDLASSASAATDAKALQRR